MQSAEEILGFKVTNFNIVVASLGGFLSLFGLVSFLLKEKFYLSEVFISTFFGLAFSPHGANFIKPLDYAEGGILNLDSITLYFSRLTLGVQLVLAGIQLPSRYLKIEWKALAVLLGPGMCAMWISSSLLVWALVPDTPILHALAVGACVTPTDPVLSNNIVKGKFADQNIPPELQKIIIAESGANDGLGYPFLFLALYLIKYTQDGGLGETGGAAKAMGYWFGITWGYTIMLSVLYGCVVGYIFREALHWAERKKYVDRESFLVFAITIALFIVGTCGMIGSDDVLACFVAGNVFTWDDWFRLQTMDDSFQPTIDMLFNVAIFVWYGAIAPWYQFAHNDIVPIYRLIFLGILVLLFRRLPFVLAVHSRIRHIESFRHALFVGFFGPVGVSAIFYLYTSLEFLRGIQVNGTQRSDAAKLSDMMFIVVWFMTICSIVVHGLSVPLGKLGLYIPRTLSRAISSENVSVSGDDSLPFRIRRRLSAEPRTIEDGVSQAFVRGKSGGADGQNIAKPQRGSSQLPRPMYRIGGTVIKEASAAQPASRAVSVFSEGLSEEQVTTAGNHIEPQAHKPGGKPHLSSSSNIDLEKRGDGSGSGSGNASPPELASHTEKLKSSPTVFGKRESDSDSSDNGTRNNINNLVEKEVHEESHTPHSGTTTPTALPSLPAQFLRNRVITFPDQK